MRSCATCGPSGTEPEHEHADLRYFLATEHPDAIAPENEQSPLRWLTIAEARALVGDNNLSETLDRAERLFDQTPRITATSARREPRRPTPPSDNSKKRARQCRTGPFTGSSSATGATPTGTTCPSSTPVRQTYRA